MIALTLIASAGIALWSAVRVRGRPVVGSRVFIALVMAVAFWCLTSAFHALAGSLETKIVWAQVQYVGIALVPPLWLLFTASYAGVQWFALPGAGEAGYADPAKARHYARLAALWTIPGITVAVAATSGWHQALWTSVRLSPEGMAVYAHGWWFVVVVAYSYAVLLAGTLLIGRTLGTSQAPVRGQSWMLIAASVIPWSGNMLYLAGWRPVGGIDVTPLGFAVSTVLFAWSLYRRHLFALVPVARDLVIDSLADAMVVVDASRQVLDMNATAAALAREKGRAGTTKGMWIGQPVDRVFPMLRGVPLAPGSRLLTSKWLKTAGAPATFELRVLPVAAEAAAFDAWVLLLRDITEARLAEESRDALQERMQEQQRRESLSILAAGLAHDFNNLLAGIVGNADLLAMQVPASSSMGSSVGAILLGAQRAADLVSKMLAYAGERHGSMARIDLSELTRELLELLRASAARDCTIHYQGGPALIDADPTQIRQIAMNLIINAAEALDQRPGTVTVATGTEFLDARRFSEMRFGKDAAPGEYAFLDVRDDGPGMPPDVLQRIFQPFFSTKHEGHGLGLAAVQGIVLGHRGALAVESYPGWGSRFCVWLPVAARQESGVRSEDAGLAVGPQEVVIR